MKTLQTIVVALTMLVCCAAYSAPTTPLSGHDLLVAVASNAYPPPTTAEIACGDFIPAFTKLKVDGRCTAVVATLPHIAFVGDSHIAHYRPSILGMFKSLAPLVISQTECFPFTADDFRSKMRGDATCDDKQVALLAYLKTTPSIQTVVLSARWSALMAGDGFEAKGEKWLKLSGMTPVERASFIKNGQSFIGTLLKAGKKVVLMRDVPDLDFEPSTCYNIRPVRLGKVEVRQNCSMAQASYEPRRQAQNAVLDEMLKPFPQVKVYDPAPVFCQNGVCKASDGTLPYYLNIDHVNNYGAQLVFKDFVPKMFPELKP